MAPALPRLGCWCIQVPRGYRPRKSCPASAVARSSRPAPSPATHRVTQAVLGRIAKVLGSMEGTSHPGDTQNRCRLAYRAGFRLYWKWLSRAKSRGRRKPVSKEIRGLIFQMVADNPTWGAPRIHGELLKLGFDLSEPTVSRWVRRAPRPPDPARRWLIFLRNHREAIAAMDFFTVPTLTYPPSGPIASGQDWPRHPQCDHSPRWDSPAPSAPPNPLSPHQLWAVRRNHGIWIRRTC